MLHVVLLCLFVGQVPPANPQVPYPSAGQSLPSSPAPGITPSTTEQLSTDPQAQRAWLLGHLIADMQAPGRYDAQRFH
jgi:hypothetical protein